MTAPNLKPIKYINDPVYGGIPVTQLELELIDTSAFQRLRGLRQLAKVNYVFPGAEHSRFVHSLGVLYIMGLMTDQLLKCQAIFEEDAIKMRVAALLHDIGHYPLSHLGEAVYGYCKDNLSAGKIIEQLSSDEIKNPPLHELSSSHSKAAHHEQLGKYIVVNNKEIKQILCKYGLDPEEIGTIFTGEIGSRNMVYSQLLHSSLDADRLDYLLRDSYQTGVKYGLVDLQYLIRLLMVVKDKQLSPGNDRVLVCNKKGQHVVEHFLMSRYFHYSQVVFHKTNAAFEGMIKSMYIKLVQSGGFIFNSLEDIHSGINTDDFLNFNDAALDSALLNYYKSNHSDDEYKKLYEMYRDRIRPKVVFEMKDLYSENPSSDFSSLKWQLKRYPEKFTELLGTSLWGYQIVPITIEKIQSHYTLSEAMKRNHDEDLREAVKVYDPDTKSVSYLAEDKLSVINKLSNYRSEFIRIYVLGKEIKNEEFKMMQNRIIEYIKS